MCYPFLKYECRRFLNVTSRILLLGYINYLTLSVLAAFRRVFVIATYILQDFKSKINIEEDINPFATGNTPVCGWRFEPVHVVLKKISLRFPSNSEADASELLINIEEIFIRYLESWSNGRVEFDIKIVRLQMEVLYAEIFKYSTRVKSVDVINRRHCWLFMANKVWHKVSSK